MSRAAATKPRPAPAAPAASAGGTTGRGDIARDAVAGLLPYQQRWVRDRAGVVLWEKSRRIGADYCEAFRAVLVRMSGARSDDYWYSSADESAAVEFMEYVRAFCEMFGAAVEIATGEELFDRDAVKVMSVRLPDVAKTGRRPRITAMSSSPKSFRSKGGSVTLSEFAFHRDAEQLWKACTPVTTWGGEIRIISTHNGVKSHFHRLCEGARRHTQPEVFGEARSDDVPLSLHVTTIDDAIGDGLVERINATKGTTFTREGFRAEMRARAGSELAFSEEYLCKPNADDESYLPYSLIRPCVHPDAARPTASLAAFLSQISQRADKGMDRLVLGCDVGRTKDLFVLWALGVWGAARRTVGVLAFSGQPFSVMEGCLRSAMDHDFGGKRAHRLCIDATGLGMQLAERMTQRYPARAEAVTFTASTKASLVSLLRRDIEERTVTLPDDPATLADLSSLRCVYTEAGNIRFAADSTDSGHADRAMALALALHADERRSRFRWVDGELA